MLMTALAAVLVDTSMIAASHAVGGSGAEWIIAAGSAIAGLGIIFRALRSLDRATAGLLEMKPTMDILTADLVQGRGLESRVATIELNVAQLRDALTISDKPGVNTLVEYIRDWRHEDGNLSARVVGSIDLLAAGINRLSVLAAAVEANQKLLTRLADGTSVAAAASIDPPAVTPSG